MFRAPLLLLFCLARFTPSLGAAEPTDPVRPHPFGKTQHTVEHRQGEQTPRLLAAEIRWISEPWYRASADENAQMPYLTYFPEKDRLLMLVETHQPVKTAFIVSDDRGRTWSDRRWFRTDANGQPEGFVLGLTNLGGGKLLVSPENVVDGRWVSEDYGETWKHIPAHDTVKERYLWDPLLVVRQSTGEIAKLVEASWRPTGVAWASADGFYSQAYLRTSSDLAQSWSPEVKVPQWLGVNEVHLLRAANGDWVAACRTDYPQRFARYGLDHFGGLAVSLSKDEGETWSALRPLYESGRHHPSMVLTEDGAIVMTYVVRLGFPATFEGYPQFGVEAIVSRDHGQTWDHDHRYILAHWAGNITGLNAWFCGVQSTSTVRLADGTMLTAFGTGFRNPAQATVCKMDVGLVRWRLEGDLPGSK